MTIRLLTITLAVLFAAGTSTAVYAVEALSTEELISHCKEYEKDPEGMDGIFCVRYIQGFIDGAIATDERVTYNVANEYDRSETLTERAIRMRVGSRMERFGPSVYAEFCLGEPLLLAAVAKTVIYDLASIKNLDGRELARNVVYETLRREYPCSADDE